MDGSQFVKKVCGYSVCFGLIYAVLLKEKIL